MSRRRHRRAVALLAAAGPVALATAFFACGPERDDGQPRYFFPPDANEEDALPQPDAPARDGTVDTGTDSGLDADADADAALPPLVRALATGSSDGIDPLVGYGDHTCTIAGPTRSLYCWGANDRGQIGNGKTGAGTTAEDVAAATKIAVDETGLAFEGIEEVSASGFHSCARRGADLFCWGQRFSGAQAEPPFANPDRVAPRAIGNLDVKRIAAGGPHSCVLKSTGTITCFGHSSFSELGRPYAMDPTCAAPFFYDYVGNANHQCSGTLVDVMFGTLLGTATVAAGETHSCALAAGKVHCWGASADGELGRPNVGPSELNAQTVVTNPTALTALEGVTAIATDGARHTCAVRNAGLVVGEVVCWGVNDVGQIGAATATVPKRDHAVAVPGLANVTAIGVGPRVSCAVKADTSVACWGNDLAEAGDGGAASSPTPIAIKGPLGVGVLNNVVSVSPGLRHACARKKDDTVWCWGKNDRGQLGDGTKVDSAYPVKVVGLP
ncbi:MAG: hypothetical protein JST00_11470 [Deltaproteobacteria bacterium]|nr:hypothetical protein [Deltaproteobacteria bacterium]